MLHKVSAMLLLCVAAVVLGLLSAGQAVPLTCEALLKPLEMTNLDMLLGKWILIGDSSQVPGANTLGKILLHNVWVEITPTSDRNTVKSVQIQKILNGCQSIRINVTLENNTLHIVKPIKMTQVLLKNTCPDCAVIHSKFHLAGKTFKGLMLTSRRREVTSEELDSFKKQVECLGLPPPLILKPLSDLCPHPDTPTDRLLTTDVTETFEAVQADPLTCEALLKPLEITNLDMLPGKWMVIGETSQMPGFRILGKLLNSSSWVEFTATSDSNRVLYTEIYNTGGVCYSIRFNMTLQDNTMNIAPLACPQVLLKTECSDCLLIQSSCTMAGETFLGLELLSKRREVTSAELDSFKKQAECLNLHRPLVISPQSELCPHPDSPTDEQETPDLSEVFEVEDEDLTMLMETCIKHLIHITRFLENLYFSIFPDSKK